MKTGDEYDALTRWRRYLFWKPGERKRIKTKFRRRVRRIVKKMLRDPRQTSTIWCTNTVAIA